MTACQDCPGVGRCHGPMKWCDGCGDVGDVCDASATDDCDCHRCSSCRKWPLKLSDLICVACEIDLERASAEAGMLAAATRGNETSVQLHAARLKALEAVR